VKKITAFVLALAMMFVFTACSGKSETPSGEKVKTGIIIEYDTNLLLYKYDVRISVDDSVVGSLKQGKKEL